jgi:guanylate cyclase
MASAWLDLRLAMARVRILIDPLRQERNAMRQVANSTVHRLSSAFEGFGALPEDSEELRLQKKTLVVGSVMFICAGTLWGLLYILFGEPMAGWIPLIYSILSTALLMIFGLTGEYVLYRDSQLLLILVLPFFLMISLGGFFNSSAVILWSLICPLGSLLLVHPRRSLRWLIGYLVLLLISGLLQPYVRPANNLSEDLVLLFFILNIGAVSAIIYILVAYFERGRTIALQLLRVEQVKSERLLYNVLPKGVVPLLKGGNRSIAERFDSVSILFADVVGFTSLSTKLAPEEMVELLNTIFSYFDSLVEKHQLEKIRTIGDNYMVASGAPIRRADHAQVLARLALEMNEYISNSPSLGKNDVQFRIGMNSGPAVGGVIGTQKFHYDLWGEAVNTASRMESHGLPGRIQISKDTYELIKDDFDCRHRGDILVKGIGPMETWFLEGKREQSTVSVTA